jgi:translation initiation factor IF-2
MPGFLKRKGRQVISSGVGGITESDVMLAATQVDQAAANLARFAARVDTSKRGSRPSSV